MICKNCKSKAIWTGCTPTGNKYMCSNLECRRVTLFAMVEPAPVENVTLCVICGNLLTGNTGQQTCSNKCRQKKYRLDRGIRGAKTRFSDV